MIDKFQSAVLVKQNQDLKILNTKLPKELEKGKF